MVDKGPKQLTLTDIPGVFGKGMERIGHRIVWREVFRTWHLRQRRAHHLVQTSIPTHQYKRSSILSVRVTPRWQEASAWHACMIHGLAKSGT